MNTSDNGNDDPFIETTDFEVDTQEWQNQEAVKYEEESFDVFARAEVSWNSSKYDTPFDNSYHADDYMGETDIPLLDDGRENPFVTKQDLTTREGFRRHHIEKQLATKGLHVTYEEYVRHKKMRRQREKKLVYLPKLYADTPKLRMALSAAIRVRTCASFFMYVPTIRGIMHLM